MNAAADYYGIAHLVELSRSRIHTILETKWDPAGFFEAAKLAFDSTSDDALLEMLKDYAAKHILELVEQLEVAPDILNDFSFGVIKNMAQTHAATEMNLRRRVELAETEIDTLKRQMERANMALDEIEKVERLSTRECCRNLHCDNVFGSWLENVGSKWEPLFVLRCSKCNCKHQYTEETRRRR